jgi:hypothetical protein
MSRLLLRDESIRLLLTGSRNYHMNVTSSRSIPTVAPTSTPIRLLNFFETNFGALWKHHLIFGHAFLLVVLTGNF